MNWERVRRMLVKEFIHVFRDPRMRAVVLVIPVLQVVMFGYAVTTDVRNVATAVYDLDNTEASRELVARCMASGYFREAARITREAQVRDLMDRGAVRVVLRLDRGFEREMLAGRTAAVQVLVDGTDSNTAGIILDYSARIAAGMANAIRVERLARLRGEAGPVPAVDLQVRAWFNENLESRLFYVPGVIAMLVTLVTLLLTGMAVVREKESGTIEQILVTPITPAEFILGKTLPFALIGFLDVIVVTVIGVLVFGVPIRGSLALLFLATAFYLMSTLGVGLLISTISQTQQQAMMSTFFYYFPAVLLSGFMFPIANMPEPVQWLTALNPFRYFLVIIRALFLKGAGLSVLWPNLLALLVMGLLTLRLAAGRFRKTLS